MKHTAALAIPVCTAALLTACSSSDETASAPTSGTSAVSTTAAAGDSPYIEVVVGKPFAISNAAGQTGTVTLQKIEIAPTCSTAYGPVTPAAGTYVALLFDVQTTATPPQAQISEYWFEELTPEDHNKRIPFTDNECIGDREHFGGPFRPSSKYTGWVELDVSNPKSAVLMSDLWDGRVPAETHRIKLTS